MDTDFGGAIQYMADAIGRGNGPLREAFERGASKAVIDLLRSDDALTKEERHEIADLLQGLLGLERGSRAAIVPAHVKRMLVEEVDRRSGLLRAYKIKVPQEEIWEHVAFWFRRDPLSQKMYSHLRANGDQIGQMVRHREKKQKPPE
jgi:hypothetical protein